jgi:hypothetical protein
MHAETRRMLNRLDDRMKAKGSCDNLPLQEAMAHTVIVAMSLYREGKITYNYMRVIVTALPHPNEAISRAIEILDGIEQKEFHVRLHIGNNTEMEHVVNALASDEPDVYDEICNMSDGHNVCLIIEHDYSHISGKQVAVYAVSDIHDYMV